MRTIRGGIIMATYTHQPILNTIAGAAGRRLYEK